MTGSHGSVATRSRANERALWLALIPTATFMVVEVAAGFLTGSLALISDAGHMATDVFGIAIAIFGVRISRRIADQKRSFGYERFEVLAAVTNALLLFGVGLYILVEAYGRLYEPPTVQSVPMLVVATIGLAVNLVSMRFLAQGKDHSLNLKGAYLEVWSDLLGSIGVIVAAVLIWATGLYIFDTLIAVAIGLWVFPRTWILLRDGINLLLEGVPTGIDLNEVSASLTTVDGVTDVHDLHVWALTSGRVCLMAHVVAPSRAGDADVMIEGIRRDLHAKFGIGHVTIQLETTACSDGSRGHRFLE